MYRFFAIYRHENSPEAHRIHSNILSGIQALWPGWKSQLNSSNLCVLEWADERSCARGHTLADEQGAIFGFLFNPKPDGTTNSLSRRAPLKINAEETEKIIRSRGVRLKEDYWGSYIAILRTENGDGVRIFRSPFARIGCFHFSAQGVSIFFSDVRLLEFLTEYGARIDWLFAPIYLRWAYNATEKIAFHNTKYLIHGQCAEITPEGSKIYYLWDPTAYAAGSQIDDVDLAKKRLRNVANACMDAWLSVLPRTALLISGGFDSSSLAGLMAKAQSKSKIICITHYGEDFLSDERHYARRTAEKWGYKYIEVEAQKTDMHLSRLPTLPKNPWPNASIINFDYHRKVINLAVEHGVHAKVTGEGGDTLFVRACGGIGQDYVYDRGLGRDFFRIAFADAMVENRPVWLALREMIMCRLGMRPQTRVPYGVDIIDPYWGLTPEIADHIRTMNPLGPWASSDARIAPGKKSSLASLMYPYYEGVMFEDLPAIETIEPIHSQPLAEICLQIPTYIHQYNGRERGLAREAFADCLIDEVRLRRHKASGTGFFLRTLVDHKHFYRDYLLGGVLAERRWIDKEVVERAFSDAALETSAQGVKILRYADVETWLRGWL